MVPVISVTHTCFSTTHFYEPGKKKFRLFPRLQTHTPFTSLHLLTSWQRMSDMSPVTAGTRIFQLRSSSSCRHFCYTFACCMFFYVVVQRPSSVNGLNTMNLISWQHKRPKWEVCLWLNIKSLTAWSDVVTEDVQKVLDVSLWA